MRQHGHLGETSRPARGHQACWSLVRLLLAIEADPVTLTKVEELLPRVKASGTLVRLAEDEDAAVGDVQLLGDIDHGGQQVWCRDDEAGPRLLDQVGQLILLVSWVRPNEDGARSNDREEENGVVDLREESANRQVRRP